LRRGLTHPAFSCKLALPLGMMVFYENN